MTAAKTGLDLVRLYGEVSFALAAGTALFFAFRRAAEALGLELHRGIWLRVGQGLLLFSLLSPFVLPWIPSPLDFPDSIRYVQIWSGADSGTPGEILRLGTSLLTSQQSPFAFKGLIFPAQAAPSFWLALLLMALLVLAHLAWQWRQLHNSVHQLPVLRRLGRVVIAVTDEATVPFAALVGRSAYVVVPSSLILDSINLRLSVRHELQHHRQRDTVWIYLMRILRAFFLWHPAIYLWERQLSACQEFACDEALLRGNRVRAEVYGYCLLGAARQSLQSQTLFFTAGMARDNSLLKLRLKQILRFKQRRASRALTWTLGLSLLLALGTLGLVARGLVRDRRVSLEEAWRIADNASQGSSFPIRINDPVLKQLNRFLGTPNGRDWLKQALARMHKYRPMIERKLAAYGLPPELMALPIMESGYKNLAPSSKDPSQIPGTRGAGLWMFIGPTARRYGLKVEGQVDERLDVEKETDAAMRYLSHLYRKFQDWTLALAAFNLGEKEVTKAIQETKAGDAWELYRRNRFPEVEYLSQAMVAVLILKNPSLLD